jgi:hypothetical protein
MKNTLCFLLVLFCLSCQKQNAQPDHEPAVDINKIYGKWDWIGSSGGFAGTTYTPESEHQTRMLTITSDNKMYLYTNGNLISQKQFTVGKGKSYLTGDTAYIIHYTPASFDDVILTAKNDTLVLANDGADGFTAGYVRHK